LGADADKGDFLEAGVRGGANVRSGAARG